MTRTRRADVTRVSLVVSRSKSLLSLHALFVVVVVVVVTLMVRCVCRCAVCPRQWQCTVGGGAITRPHKRLDIDLLIDSGDRLQPTMTSAISRCLAAGSSSPQQQQKQPHHCWTHRPPLHTLDTTSTQQPSLTSSTPVNRSINKLYSI